MKISQQQMDLFGEASPVATIAADQRGKLLQLIEALLKEAATVVATAVQESGDDDENHL